MIRQNDLDPSLDTISRELIRGLPPHLGDPKAGDEAWTKAIKSSLKRFGRSKGFSVYCNGPGEHDEWLLDLIWMDQATRRIVLAVEAQRGSVDEVDADFSKLLSIKAHHKLLLFSTQHHTDSEEVVQRIESIMLAYPYHQVEEEYMLMDVSGHGAFRYCFKVPKTGLLESIHFIEMATALPWPWSRQHRTHVA